MKGSVGKIRSCKLPAVSRGCPLFPVVLFPSIVDYRHVVSNMLPEPGDIQSQAMVTLHPSNRRQRTWDGL